MTDNTEDERAAKAREIKAAYMRMWEAKNREHRKAYAREHYQKNKEKIREQSAARVTAWVTENPEARKEHLRRYREKNREKLRQAHHDYIRDENGEITAKEKQHQERNRTQRGMDMEALAGRPRPEACEACSGPPDPKKGMHFDHCHTSGNFRGWLCRECNLALGNVRGNIQRLRQLIAYLERAAAD
jgi:hypothetical protein